MAKLRKVVRIDLSSLFGDDDDPIVELTPKDELAILTYEPPKFLTLSKRDCICRNCGCAFPEFLGIFLEYDSKLSMRLERVPTSATLAQYSYLPRRIDYAPPTSVPACSGCWFVEPLLQAAMPQVSELPAPMRDIPSQPLDDSIGDLS